MKKIKIALMTIAVLLSVGGAIASRPKTFQGVWYYTGSGYAPAGIYGVNYVCVSSPYVCTYTKSGNNYIPYQNQGSYTKIGIDSATTAPETRKDKH